MFVLTAVLAGSAVAQYDSRSRGNIHGVIDDERSSRVGSLTVSLRSQDGLTSRQAQADGNGEFEFEAVPPGTCVIEVSDAFGKVLVHEVIHADPSERIRLRIADREVSQPPSGTVSARARKVKVPGAVLKEMRRANRLEEAGDVAGAVEHLRRAVSLCPDFAGSHNDLGTAYSHLNRDAEAASEFRTAQQLDPGTALYSMNLGASLAALGDFEGAANAEREALREDPRQTRARYVLGVALGALGQLRDALRYLREAAADFPIARLRAAGVLAAMGQRAEAATEVRQYLAGPGELRDRQRAERWLTELEAKR